MVDWKKRLRRASFRGVSFWVDTDDLYGGKRLAVHEVAGGKIATIEELGLKAGSVDVSAYLVGDLSSVQSAALLAAVQADGPGRLVLPLDGGLLATVEDFHRSRQKDRQGYIAFDLRFVLQSVSVSTGLTIGDVSATISLNFATASVQFSLMF